MKIQKSELEQILGFVANADKMMAIAKVQKSQVMANEAIQYAQESLFDLKHFIDANITELEDDSDKVDINKILNEED